MSVLLALAGCRASAPAPAGAATELVTNPFARSFPFESATFVYGSSNSETQYRIRGDAIRSDDTRGPFANGGWRLTDATGEYSVIPRDRKILVFHSPATALFAAYQALAPDDRERVRQSVARLGADVPFYAEQVYTAIAARDIEGFHASCFDLVSRFGTGTSERCYLRGLLVSTTGTNPIDGSSLDAVASDVVVDPPLDDALFELPSDYARETPSTDALMAEVYARLVDRMRRPDFTLASLDRYAP